MRVLVLGAAGKTGRRLVERAVDGGHQTTAFVRDPAGYRGPVGVDVVPGDATDADSVSAAVVGQDAVIDTIGGKTPYASGLTLEAEATMAAMAAMAVVTAMQRHGARRLLVTSSLGVGDSVSQATVVLRILLKTFLRGSTADKAAMERMVDGSGLDWTIARPAVLTDDAVSGVVRSLDGSSADKAHKISRDDLAAWLVAQLDTGTRAALRADGPTRGP